MVERLDREVKGKFSSRFSVVRHLQDALLLLAVSKLFAVLERLVSMVVALPDKTSPFFGREHKRVRAPTSPPSLLSHTESCWESRCKREVFVKGVQHLV
jgi:hypothetical protein